MESQVPELFSIPFERTLLTDSRRANAIVPRYRFPDTRVWISNWLELGTRSKCGTVSTNPSMNTMFYQRTMLEHNFFLSIITYLAILRRRFAEISHKKLYKNRRRWLSESLEVIG